MNDGLIQIGVGGIFCILVLREVFGFIRRRRDTGDDGNGASAGSRSVEFWQTSTYKSARQALNDALPVMTNELRELRADTTKIRESNHQIVQAIQTLTNRMEVWNDRRIKP